MGRQYIDKDAIIEEIERLSAYYDSLHEQRIIEKILSILDTLEVKEVDLDHELDFVKDAYYYFTSDERSGMKKVAEHFFELGLKAQKGE